MAYSLRGALRNLVKDEQGNVIILVGLTAFLLILSIGAAIDMTRAQILQLKMYSALDAANLAAGAAASSPPEGYTEQTWVDSEVNKFFNANFPANYLESSTVVIPSATLTNGGNTIDISANAVQSTSFMAAVGTPTVNVAAASEVTRSSNVGMELVLALDNTGSMNGPVDSSSSAIPKIAALKSAANQLVTILYGTNTSIPNFYVGIVPFTDAVNIGTSHPSWMDGSNPFPEEGPQWFGCVESRTSNHSLDISDDPPSTSGAYGSNKLFTPFFWQSGAQLPTTSPDYCPSGAYCNVWDSTTVEVGGAFIGPNSWCPQPVTQMTVDRATIVAGIDSMTAQGDTMINIGLAWAYRMLSPNWQGYWGGEMNADSLPLAYGTANMQKVVILMTDGTNHITDPAVYPGVYGAYGYLDQGNIDGITSQGEAETQLDADTLAVCNSLKSNGVVVYTIGFGQASPDNPPTQADRENNLLVDTQLLRSCATDSSHYFLAPTNAALSAAFTAIGNSLANLRISK